MGTLIIIMISIYNTTLYHLSPTPIIKAQRTLLRNQDLGNPVLRSQLLKIEAQGTVFKESLLELSTPLTLNPKP